MKNIRKASVLLILGLSLFSCRHETSTETGIYCNPLDLDYGWGIFNDKLPLCRTSADPVIVLFKDRYYLFSTQDIGGYRISEDLTNWENRYFNDEVRTAALDKYNYVAPAVAADDKYMYFIRLNRNRGEKTVKIIRTEDPDRGKWEICGEIRKVSDPTMYIEDGRYYIYHGLGANQSIKCFELDPDTFTEIPGSERLLMDHIKDVNDCDGGYHLGRRELYDEIDARQWGGQFKYLPCPEGSWIVRHNGTYYLQFATPGTISIWYCDALMTSDRPDGNFTVQPYSPVSLKAGGFIGGAGHSSVFMDRYGNWWEITTMWVGNSNEFERRLGLFPVTFDEKGRMQVHTTFGDYPMILPQYRFDARDGYLKNWWCLSYNKKCTASSQTEGHGPEMGCDENVRTWWSAETGKSGEWFMIDLGGIKTVNAIQLNFSEQNFTPETFAEDFTSYVVYSSPNGNDWDILIDKSRNTRTNPHDFTVLESATDTRYLKVECVHSMNGVPFGIRDFRIFGNGNGEKPKKVENLSFTRNGRDDRIGLLEWIPVQDADGYIVRFGISPDFMNQTIQVKGGDTSSLQLHILTRNQKYCFAIYAYNENGISEACSPDNLN